MGCVNKDVCKYRIWIIWLTKEKKKKLVFSSFFAFKLIYFKSYFLFYLESWTNTGKNCHFKQKHKKPHKYCMKIYFYFIQCEVSVPSTQQIQPKLQFSALCVVFVVRQKSNLLGQHFLHRQNWIRVSKWGISF